MGGNFVGQLSPFEALGVWPRPDFRLATGGKWWLELGAALAAVLVVAGLVRAGRRDRALLAAALAGLTVYVVARPTTLAYFSGKALAVASPVLALAAVSFLLAELRERRRWPARTAVALAAGTFALLALYSSALALRAAHVRPHERGADLSAFRPLVRNAPVLYLARDAFFGWELRGLRRRRLPAGRRRRPDQPRARVREDRARPAHGGRRGLGRPPAASTTTATSSRRVRHTRRSSRPT